MPTYAYKCDQGHEFEEFQSIVALPLEVCPRCGARVERVISGGTGLIFKGSGFYITDYAKKSGDGSSGKPSSAKSAESKSAEPKSAEPTSTESKPAGEKSSAGGDNAT
jgi:putative FmdB family regulatory protein